MLIGQWRSDYDRRSRLTASEAEPEYQSEYFGVVFKTLANLFLARVLTGRAEPVSCVVDASREQRKRLRACRKAVSLAVYVYDVIDILKGFLEQKRDFKKI